MNSFLWLLQVACIFFIFFSSPVLAQEAHGFSRNAPITYDEIRHWAIHDCRARSPKKIDTAIIDLLIEVEKENSIPKNLRGMILAAACMESGYNPLAKGDYRSVRGKRRPKAIGIMQLWPWTSSKKYGDSMLDRTNPRAAATFWINHVITRIPKVKKRCRFKSKKKIWIAAWVTAVRAPKPGGRCYETPKHLKILKRWYRKIRKQRLSYRT